MRSTTFCVELNSPLTLTTQLLPQPTPSTGEGTVGVGVGKKRTEALDIGGGEGRRLTALLQQGGAMLSIALLTKAHLARQASMFSHVYIQD